MSRGAGGAVFALLLAAMAGALGYAFIGTIWRESRVVMHLQLGDPGGTLIDGSSSWDAVAETALAIWNGYIRDAQFYVVCGSTGSVGDGDGDGANNVYFSDTVYGSGFGGAVAITTEWRSGGYRTEGDVVFNTAYSWNSYRGPLLNATDGGTLYDLRRVALHEFGHVLGLDHPDEAGQSVVAVMNSRVSGVDGLRDDDIAGAQALYGAGKSGGSLGRFKKPKKSAIATSRRKMTFRGVADGNRVAAVYLRSHRTGAKSFKARGVSSWKRGLRLKPGVNRILLCVDTGAANLKKVDRVRVNVR